MRGRLVIAIITTSLEEVALLAIWLWGLPRVGIHIPLWVLIVVMLGWGTYTVVTFRMGSRALRRKPVAGLIAMVGSRGKVVSRLAPEGCIRIKGELWWAISADEGINVGEEVTVLRQDRLKLIVCKSGNSDLKGTE